MQLVVLFLKFDMLIVDVSGRGKTKHLPNVDNRLMGMEKLTTAQLVG
jgi:hypothetical protein